MSEASEESKGDIEALDEESIVFEGEERFELVVRDFNLSRSELKRIAKLGEKVVPQLPGIVDQFYEWLESQPYFSHYFPDTDQVKRVKKLQISYWESFFNGSLDTEFIEKHRKVAEVHAKIDLPLEYYMSGFNFFFEAIYKLILELESGSDVDGRDLLAFTKLLHLDMTLVANTFSTAHSQREIAQSKAAWEMSTPVAQVWDKVLLLPLSGLIDSQRALEITSKILQSISESQSEIFILDISGVGVVDSAVANYLIRVTKATRLMGCDSVISGLSPSIAQSIVNLGIEVDAIKTTTTLKDALKFAFKRLGYQLILPGNVHSRESH